MGAKPIVLGGKTYRSIEEMPPDVREKYELAMCLVGDPDKNNILHTVESLNHLADQDRNSTDHGSEKIASADLSLPALGRNHRDFSPSERVAPAATSHAKPLASIPMITPDRSEGWSIAFAILFVLILCAMVGAWYFFLR